MRLHLQSTNDVDGGVAVGPVGPVVVDRVISLAIESVTFRRTLRLVLVVVVCIPGGRTFGWPGAFPLGSSVML